MSVFSMNTDDGGSVLRQHTGNNNSVFCVLGTNSASLHYVNSYNVTMSGELNAV